jgi:hypothetical protein
LHKYPEQSLALLHGKRDSKGGEKMKKGDGKVREREDGQMKEKQE